VLAAKQAVITAALQRAKARETPLRAKGVDEA
jgi:hypothetical protein